MVAARASKRGVYRAGECNNTSTRSPDARAVLPAVSFPCRLLGAVKITTTKLCPYILQLHRGVMIAVRTVSLHTILLCRSRDKIRPRVTNKVTKSGVTPLPRLSRDET